MKGRIATGHANVFDLLFASSDRQKQCYTKFGECADLLSIQFTIYKIENFAGFGVDRRHT
jgi:lysozyme family protein